MFDAIASVVGTHLTNRANKKIANTQMQFQERMSSSAYQRAMQDMKKAGLNPILAGKMGGASTPAGAGIPAQDYGQAYTRGQSVSNAKVLQTAQAQQAQANARLATANADLAQLDVNTLKRLKLSPMQMKHTVLNQGGSELYNTARDLYSDVKKEYLPKIIQDDFIKEFVTGKALTKGMQGTTLDNFLRDIVKKAKNYIKSRTGGKRTRYVK